jgi:glycerol-3-phosphate acyltransferase PlsY
VVPPSPFVPLGSCNNLLEDKLIYSPYLWAFTSTGQPYRLACMNQFLITNILVILVSYLLGCFSTAYYLVRWRTGQDIRQLGSGTAGARNVGRILGKGGFVATFLVDAIKGALAVQLANWAGLSSSGLIAVLLAVVMGHLWPIQLGWRGGKGASTAFGGVLLLNVTLGLIVAAIALILLAVMRRFTRSGLIAVIFTPLVAWLLGVEDLVVGGLVVLAILLLFAHRASFIPQPLSSHST